MEAAVVINLADKKRRIPPRKFNNPVDAQTGNMKRWAAHFKKNVSALTFEEAIDFYANPRVLIQSRGFLPEIQKTHWVSSWKNKKCIWAEEWEDVPLTEVKLILRDLRTISSSASVKRLSHSLS
jgi:hypothetical protein